MANKMLIDASHPEETRVVVVKGDKVEDFDFESANRKQLRGNIYLAKVTRVEPSLQAAFVDYGGNRHGFLAFSEIHPDYYQIPVADRQALVAEEAEHDLEQARTDEQEIEDAPRKRRRRRSSAATAKADETVSEEAETDSSEEDTAEADSGDDDADAVEASAEESDVSNDESQDDPEKTSDPDAIEASADDATEADESDEPGEDDGNEDDDDSVESFESEDALEEVPVRSRPRARRYKIQEVIKRNQILLIQVVKEERGTKGAALTTYMSIAGRYCVLMPNTARGGGISRKITNSSDRKRLRTIVTELELPVGMGLILRTAGASRTKAEIKRDFEYLLRMWETVRDTTLDSTAPTLVYEEGSLVKRSIRDLYSKEIDEVLVSGDEAYKDAKAFMRTLTPSHAKNIKAYKESAPIFTRFNIENQLSAMFSPQVRLPSGGYIVIDQAEALVAIDVNSGKATRAHNIEATALATNLEAAAEVSRQFRLRDLAGLIVIDFIDMDEKRNNRAVERKLKDCLKRDRARIQIGHISHFGLLEMSRQRMRSGVLEGSTDMCAYCQGTGVIRSTESVALHILRMVEDALMKDSSQDLVLRTTTEVALYILNSKRAHLAEIETRFGTSIAIQADGKLAGVDHVIIRGDVEIRQNGVDDRAGDSSDSRSDRGRKRRRGGRRNRNESQKSDDVSDDGENEIAASGDGDEDSEEARPERKRGRRRGRRGGRGRRPSGERTAMENGEDRDQTEASQDASETVAEDAKDDGGEETTAARKPRRRRRRGGSDTAEKTEASAEEVVATDASTGPEQDASPDDAPAEKAPRRRRAPRARKAADTEISSEESTPDEAAASADSDEKPKRGRRKKAAPESQETGNGEDSGREQSASAPDPAPVPEKSPSTTSAPAGPQRTGWWRKSDG
jgi:ribonuclease E